MNLFPADLKTETWTVVRAEDLDAYIEKCLGRPWRLQQNAFFANDSIQWFEVEKDPAATGKVQEWLDSPPVAFVGRVDQPGTAGWLPDNRPLAEVDGIYTSVILNELCNRGLFPEGVVRVYVAW